MLKLIGAIMIAGACSAMGISMHRSLNARVFSLKGLISALQIIKAEIVFRRTSIPDIMHLIVLQTEGGVKDWFISLAAAMDHGSSFPSAYQKLMADLSSLSLTASDIALLSQGFNVLGKYDAVSQSEILSGVLARLQGEWEQANADAAQKGKLYRALTLSAGIMLALIVL